MFGCGDLILHLDKLIRSDRAKLVPSRVLLEKRLNEVSYSKNTTSTCRGSYQPDSSPKEELVAEDVFICAPRVVACLNSDATPTSSGGKNDMRQVRLFKTRFCQYGTECPYLIKGTCLYAHNREEVRLRPPPPKGYKPPVSSVIGEPVWNDPKSQGSSILDCLPRSSVSGLVTLMALTNQLSILDAAREEIHAKLLQRRIALAKWFPETVTDQSRELVKQVREKEHRVHALVARTQKLYVVPKLPSAIQTEKLPRRSHIVKACNQQIDASHALLGKLSSSLALLRMHLLQDVASLYPIDYQGRFRTIRGLALPSVSALKRSTDLRDEESISTALGSLVHRIDLVAKIVDFPLLFVPVIAGSKSAVKDRFSDPSLQELPLFYKGVDRGKYVLAIQLLTKSLVHFAVSRGNAPENPNDLLEMADNLLVREMVPDS